MTPPDPHAANNHPGKVSPAAIATGGLVALAAAMGIGRFV
jgi:hypothetical protein